MNRATALVALPVLPSPKPANPTNHSTKMNDKQFAADNARTQAAPHGLVRAGNSIEWFTCDCGEQSNLLWTYKTNKSRILACSLDCALAKAKAQVKLGFLVDD